MVYMKSYDGLLDVWLIEAGKDNAFNRKRYAD